MLKRWVAANNGRLDPSTEEIAQLSRVVRMPEDQVGNWFHRQRQQRAAVNLPRAAAVNAPPIIANVTNPHDHPITANVVGVDPNAAPGEAYGVLLALYLDHQRQFNHDMLEHNRQFNHYMLEHNRQFNSRFRQIILAVQARGDNNGNGADGNAGANI